MPRQEKGTRQSCALPYQLYADAKLSKDKKSVEVTFAAKNEIFGQLSAGAPFNVYAPGNYRSNKQLNFESVKTWAYAVKSGDEINNSWALHNFEKDQYFLRVYGPNGFFSRI